jgi:hypothetical protein
MFLRPANSKTVRTDPPAITPLPNASGRNIILQSPKDALITCGTEYLKVIGTLIKFFFPFKIAFSIAKISL